MKNVFTKEVHDKPLFTNEERYTVYYRNEKLYGVSWSSGKKQLYVHEEAEACVTRTQAYRYWKKYFSNRHCDYLPSILKEAVDIDSEADGIINPRYGFGKHGKVYYYLDEEKEKIKNEKYLKYLEKEDEKFFNSLTTEEFEELVDKVLEEIKL